MEQNPCPDRANSNDDEANDKDDDCDDHDDDECDGRCSEPDMVIAIAMSHESHSRRYSVCFIS